TSSLQRDIAAGRRAELETFPGYLVKEAKRLGVLVPVSERMYEEMKNSASDCAGSSAKK
ncbi:MAG: ketopantoate reductase C-terminal domain-containing protein, partial [Hespellia sp.]|nr:ketopantoate reductase C-terminal domain-containing protein [Hespellia sp.]